MLSIYNTNRIYLYSNEKRRPKKTTVNLIRTYEAETGNMFDQLDVRGKRAEDALYSGSRYLDDAIVNQTRHLKILHGTDKGILREVIRDYLRSQAIEKHYKDERL